MMKAILVIDMPNECWDCPLHRNSWDEDNEEIMICRGTYMESHYGERPDWCPLKPMPKKRTLPTWQTVGMPKGNEPWFTEGYNKCIDEILGKKNDEENNIKKES